MIGLRGRWSILHGCDSIAVWPETGPLPALRETLRGNRVLAATQREKPFADRTCVIAPWPHKEKMLTGDRFATESAHEPALGTALCSPAKPGGYPLEPGRLRRYHGQMESGGGDMEEMTIDNLLGKFVAELRMSARRLLAHERDAQSIQSMDLVDSAIRRVLSSGLDWSQVTWPNRRYFFGAAHRAMRQALVDHARLRKAGRRLPLNCRIHLDQIHLQNLADMANKQPEVIEALEEVLARMEVRYPKWAELIQHRFFSGYELKEAAKVMEISDRTAGRYWREARLYLYHEILRLLNGADPISKENGGEIEHRPQDGSGL
jgi:RNA polymerase sigma factor (TIGR02999 family)